MGTLNPYESFLDGRPVLDILRSTSAALSQLIGAIPADRVIMSPAPGKWSPAQIVSHLADCEIAFSFRLRQTLAEDNHVIQPFDQDKWAAVYDGVDATLALQTFAALRAWNVSLVQAAPAGSGSKTVTHPERGTMTFQTIIETMAGHDLNHIAQLKRIAGQA
jgi:hypothetical protein